MAGEDQGNVAVADAPASDPIAPEVVEEQVAAAPEPEAESAEGSETEATTETPPSKWAGKTDTEIEAAIEAIRKDTEARTRQSATDKANAEWSRRQVQQSTDYVTKGGLMSDLNAISKAVLNGDANVTDDAGNLKPAVAQTILDRAYAALADKALLGHLEIVGDMLNGQEITQEQRNEVELLMLKMRQTDSRTHLPLASHDDVIRKATEQVIAARIKAETPKIEEAYAKRMAETAKKRGEVGAMRESDQARTSTMRPTGGNGRSASAGHGAKTVIELDRMLADGTVDLPRGPGSREAYRQMAAGLPYS